MHKTKKHSAYYLTLFILFALGVILILQASYDKHLQIAAVLLIVIMYVALGIVHHWHDHSLHKKIMVEYVLIGITGASILLFFLQ